MRRFFIFLAVLAIALLGLFVWWQRNATRVITTAIHNQARNFFDNPRQLRVENKPIKLTGLRQARVPQLVISGTDLRVQGEGGKLAFVKLVLTDVDVSGPPFHFVGVGSGYYMVKVTDRDVTDYVRRRGIRILTGKIPTDTISVIFTKKEGTTILGKYTLPIINKAVQIKAVGSLVPSSKLGQVDLRVRQVGGVAAKQFTDAVTVLNPLIDVSSWPIEADIKSVTTTNGKVAITGRITGIRPSLLP
ncbi:MAG: LmeA family phospholipid-binding protein [Armatimonadota bacterium]